MAIASGECRGFFATIHRERAIGPGVAREIYAIFWEKAKTSGFFVAARALHGSTIQPMSEALYPANDLLLTTAQTLGIILFQSMLLGLSIPVQIAPLVLRVISTPPGSGKQIPACLDDFASYDKAARSVAAHVQQAASTRDLARWSLDFQLSQRDAWLQGRFG